MHQDQQPAPASTLNENMVFIRNSILFPGMALLSACVGGLEMKKISIDYIAATGLGWGAVNAARVAIEFTVLYCYDRNVPHEFDIASTENSWVPALAGAVTSPLGAMIGIGIFNALDINQSDPYEAAKTTSIGAATGIAASVGLYGAWKLFRHFVPAAPVLDQQPQQGQQEEEDNGLDISFR